jgi:hypothetical protein
VIDWAAKVEGRVQTILVAARDVRRFNLLVAKPAGAAAASADVERQRHAPRT